MAAKKSKPATKKPATKTKTAPATKSAAPAKPKLSAARREYAADHTPEHEAAIDMQVAMFAAGMKRAGLTPATLAERLGVTETRARQILDGRSMSVGLVTAVLTAMGMKLQMTATPIK